MMKHLIIGAGNLGKDLLLEINAQRAGSPFLASRSRGLEIFRRKAFSEDLRLSEYDVVWYCVGSGSVGEAKADPDLVYRVNVEVPFLLTEVAPKHTRIMFFSSDYAADELHPTRADRTNPTPLSRYADTKVCLERMLIQRNRPLTAFVRVGSLYGVHKPQKTFPGKLLKTFAEAPADIQIELPSNLVTPTPTRWLAGMLLKHFDRLFSDQRALAHHCAPRGNVSVRDWGMFVLAGIRDYQAFGKREFYDEERPLFSNLECSFSRENWHWTDLWGTYYKASWFMPKIERTLQPFEMTRHDSPRENSSR